MQLLYNSAILLLYIYWIGVKPYGHKMTCTQVFIETLFVEGKGKNNPDDHQQLNE